MENFQRNKIFSDVFVRYLKNKFGWKYLSVEPSEGDADVRLFSEKQEILFLQLKEVKKHINTKMTPMTPGSKSKLSLFEFSLPSLDKIIDKYERHYSDASNLILLLHLCDGYFTPSDINIINNKEKIIQSKFKGIYIVSPKIEFTSTKGNNSQEEFVSVIKDAFIVK